MIARRDGYGSGETRRSSCSSSPGEGGGNRAHRSRNLSDASGSVNSSDSEANDAVSELAPLVCGNSRHAYESIDGDDDDDGNSHRHRHDHHHRPANAAGGLSDDESIHTVTALPNMEIRCHSISSNNASGRRGHCSIRPSTAKVVSTEHAWSCLLGFVSLYCNQQIFTFLP
jgi:hypothetical protein